MRGFIFHKLLLHFRNVVSEGSFSFYPNRNQVFRHFITKISRILQQHHNSFQDFQGQNAVHLCLFDTCSLDVSRPHPRLHHHVHKSKVRGGGSAQDRSAEEEQRALSLQKKKILKSELYSQTANKTRKFTHLLREMLSQYIYSPVSSIQDVRRNEQFAFS